MLAIALLLIGAALAAWLAVPDYDAGTSFGPIAGVSVAAAQIALAAALFWRVPGAWFVAAATLGFHLMMLSLFGVVVLIFGPDHSFLSVGAIVVAGFGVVVLYSLGITSARERGARHAASTITEPPVPHCSQRLADTLGLGLSDCRLLAAPAADGDPLRCVEGVHLPGAARARPRAAHELTNQPMVWRPGARPTPPLVANERHV